MEGLKEQIEILKMLEESGVLDEETKKSVNESIGNLAKELKVDTTKIPINFMNLSDNEDPFYAKPGDSGFDIRANESGSLKPLERRLASTGLHFELPETFELQIRPRSGLAYKNGITVLNTPGTVDNGYTGEVKVLLVNLSNEEFTWEKGDRIAQGVVVNRLGQEYSTLLKVNKLSNTERGKGGFGSTGVK